MYPQSLPIEKVGRDVIEDLLDINVFSKMNGLLKNHVFLSDLKAPLFNSINLLLSLIKD